MNQKKEDATAGFFDESMIEKYPGIKIIHFDDWILDLVAYRFRVLDEFTCNIEKWTKAENSKYQVLIDEKAKGIEDKKMRDEFYEWHGEQVSVYENTYPSLSRSIAITKAFFIFENELEALVRKLEKSNVTKYEQFRKQKRKGEKGLGEIGYLYCYLKEIAKIDIARDDLWNEINAIRYMRNVIVHSDNKVAPKAVLAISNTKFSKCLKLIVKSYRLEFPENVHREVIQAFLEFFELIEKELIKKPNSLLGRRIAWDI